MTTSDAGPPAGRRLSSTAAIATLVTALVIVPMVLSARDDQRAVAVPNNGIVVSIDGARSSLDDATMTTGASAVIELDDADLVAAAWILAPTGGDPIDEGTIADPPLVLDLQRVSLGELRPGRYDLLITATRRSGETVQRAARFVIGGRP